MKRNLVLGCICLGLVSCADGKPVTDNNPALQGEPPHGELRQTGMAIPTDRENGGVDGNHVPSSQTALDTGQENTTVDEAGKNAVPKATIRRVIYSANVHLVVDNFSTFEDALPGLVKLHDGYIASAQVDRMHGAQRTGNWTVRIPVLTYDAFRKALDDLGFPELHTSMGNDVTEEFVDLQSRITSKRAVEKRIIRLLEDRAGDIKDVLAIETELGRVREEIERMEGRLRFLTDRTALTTVAISVREQRDYVPPRAPSLAARIGRTWGGSVTTLRTFFESVVLIAVALAPWLPFPAVVVIVALRLKRRLRQTAGSK